MTVSIKIGLGLVGLSATSLGITGIHHLLQPSTIGEELLKEGSTLVSEGDSSNWKKLSENHYKIETTTPDKPSNPKAINGLDLKTKTNKKEDEFKKKCDELLKTPLKTENNSDLQRKKQEAKDWCTLEGGGLKATA